MFDWKWYAFEFLKYLIKNCAQIWDRLLSEKKSL